MRQRFSETEIVTLRKDLREWYNKNRRLLPWRGDRVGEVTPPPVSPYGIMISEIMLQQTRVETVISYWLRWMESLPDVVSLANATQEEVNSLWAGLGYYRRAKALSDCAKVVVEKYHGEIPRDLDILLSLPGIGPYTAGAISSIAFNFPHAAVDGNVIRVLSRLRALNEEGTVLEKACRVLALDIVDPETPATFNQALMELGATVCKPTNPSCDSCPVRGLCQAHQLVTKRDSASEDIEEISTFFPTAVTDYPKKIPKKAPVDLRFITVAVQHQARPGKYLFSRRPPRGLLANQWEFPSVAFSLEEEEQEPSAETWALALANIATLVAIRREESNEEAQIQILRQHSLPIVHTFSHQRHHMFLLELTISADAPVREEEEGDNEPSLLWLCPEELRKKGMTTGVKKVLSALQVKDASEDDKASHGTVRGGVAKGGKKREGEATQRRQAEGSKRSKK
jgi:A/G-specific adenine glycosylase